MSTRPHPVLSTDDPDLPALTLVLPPGLDADQVLDGLARAICQVRATMATWTRLAHRNVAENAAAGDPLSQALCRSRLLTGEHAVAHIDEAIIEAFGLRDQYNAQVPGPRGAGGLPCPSRRPGTAAGDAAAGPACPPAPGSPVPGLASPDVARAIAAAVTGTAGESR